MELYQGRWEEIVGQEENSIQLPNSLDSLGIFTTNYKIYLQVLSADYA